MFILFFSFICWLIYQADTDQENLLMNIAESIPWGDKIGHFFLFGGLAFLLNQTLRFRRFSLYAFRPLLGSVLVIIFCLIEEFTQLGFPSRTFDWLDMMSDAAGIFFLSHSPLLKIIKQQFLRYMKKT
ncbi:MAG: VanZ family protein [Cyclobacteriaceae bacterium]|nr:VanZ family protein [Cyclobacteriaceae bacterium HetDA_MAG_MS6]